MDCLVRKKVVLDVLGAFFLMACLVNPAIAQVSTDAVLILHFDEGSGTTVKDESGHGNGGTIHGATWTTGISGKALQFDGMDDYVDCGSDSSLNMADEITIEAWVKPRSLSNKYMCIAGKDRSGGPQYDSYSLKIMKNNNLAFELIIDGTEKRLETSLSDENWSHFVGTYDGLNMILYKNGLEVNHVSVSGLITTQPNTNFVIGAYSNHDLFFNGIIDDVAIYSRALTSEEIEAHYLAKRAGRSTEESASTLINSVSNRIDTLKLNDASTSAIEESLKKAQSAYDIGNYDEAYELAMSAQKMVDDAYKVQQHVEFPQLEIDEAKYINPEVNEAENKSNEEKSSGMPIFIVIFAIVGLLVLAYFIFKKSDGSGKERDVSEASAIKSRIPDKGEQEEENGVLEDEDIMYETFELLEMVNKQDSLSDGEKIQALKKSSYRFLERIESKPSCGVAHFGLGLLAQMLNDWDNAIKEFELALRDNSHELYPAYSEPALIGLNEARQEKKHYTAKQAIDAKVKYEIFKMGYDKEKKENEEKSEEHEVEEIKRKECEGKSKREEIKRGEFGEPYCEVAEEETQELVKVEGTGETPKEPSKAENIVIGLFGIVFVIGAIFAIFSGHPGLALAYWLFICGVPFAILLGIVKGIQWLKRGF